MAFKIPSKILHTIMLGAIITLGLIGFQLMKETYIKIENAAPVLSQKVNPDNYNFDWNQNEFPYIQYTMNTFLGEKIVHIDLKGAPPKVSYLIQLFPLIKSLGATGILVEYEDMFPYEGMLKAISAENAYTLAEISLIQEEAEKNNLTVIPLIQTFGHLEYLLKLETFRSLREVDDAPEVICPSHDETYIVLKNMIDQIIKAHPSAQYLHIGCDEVYTVGVCDNCRRRLRDQKWERKDLYFNHVTRVAEYVMYTFPDVRPIIWADEITKENEKFIQNYRVTDVTDIMLWNYKPNTESFPSEEDMEAYTRHFKSVWIASAYKGAQNLDQIVTNPSYHLKNHRGWMYIVTTWSDRIRFKGIALTGWQRFNHFAVLCELFPVSVPSLAINLHFLTTLNDFKSKDLIKKLGCNNFIPQSPLEMKNVIISKLECRFPGFRAYSAVLMYANVLKEMEANLSFLQRPSFRFYNLAHNYTHPRMLKDHIDTLKTGLIQIDEHENVIRTSLSEIYDEHTITEWTLTNVIPHKMRLESAIRLITSMLSIRVWPKRPLASTESHWKNQFQGICGPGDVDKCTVFHLHRFAQ